MFRWLDTVGSAAVRHIRSRSIGRLPCFRSGDDTPGQ